ncbi:hypothetical protein EV702DRAFT_1157860 [Suillus placidus]|uniref:Uncharacterized protein n=1 Tax=Suillus placidus TaxID=48579 RepID=A0A9P6ZFJ4_9AGAM|nr:hypothetical protein EV702DRAFT_1157860 [Suillus placidus]
MSTSMLYNLARVYKDGGDVAMAKEAYDKLLARHRSMSINLDLRAFHTYFLIRSNFSKPAKDLVFATLKDRDKHYVESRVRRA